MSTQIAHLMHTPAKGYFWRKRYDKKTIDVMLNSKDEAEATGFAEIEPNGAMWVNFCDVRYCYTAIQGKLKSVVHSVMVQHSLISSWRG
ncbi:TPA: hypothetical protein QCD44_000378 [Enterobacter hormaechei]|uniref:hypothetical protein n=1 Tax=Enterobacter hormaechei TaxID=158836 RepID=UPI002864A501|nr:hypothetical protein [Enterobacter hormaechei]ELD3465307.1 hypothetical protein [Enterobacter hormaechei]MED5730961.1 hypothetical protein [Enterobacter hormaechei]HBM2510599.1 hypothetical protein [Enterobacter hormaechei]HBM2518563.1 hypothetical protein [Enterobacter hormaechei]HBM2527886.1 hypothetical protein [Enterobacter hormaechei]